MSADRSQAFPAGNDNVIVWLTMKVLVTGAAGFIGAALSHRLLDRGDSVSGIDNLTPYYDVSLKKARLARLTERPNFRFHLMDIADRESCAKIFPAEKPAVVVNLAAQAGVRYSIQNPHPYVESNVVGFLNVLEGCRHSGVEHLVFASTSSVYGANKKLPFSISDSVDHPVSLYAATKRANELMAHTYSCLYQTPCTGLRFFTVYGPWGRPDMALFLFTKNILAGLPIDVFNYGKHQRDFTFVDDIVEGVLRVIDAPAKADPQWNAFSPRKDHSFAPFRLYNIGNNQPVQLEEFIAAIEEAVGRNAIRNLLPLQPGDVPDTFADVDTLTEDFGFRPKTPVRDGIARFVSWYRDYYKV